MMEIFTFYVYNGTSVIKNIGSYNDTFNDFSGIVTAIYPERPGYKYIWILDN